MYFIDEFDDGADQGSQQVDGAGRHADSAWRFHGCVAPEIGSLHVPSWQRNHAQPDDESSVPVGAFHQVL